MSFKRTGAYTLVFEPGNDLPLYISAKQDTGNNQTDTGGAHDWINKVKAAKAAEHVLELGDTGWTNDTGVEVSHREGTYLDLWRRYDTGAGAGGDWDKTSWRVTR
jgi:hypothetical protein